ncbi:DUF1934 domain-containing protein [Eubacterium coprostanoligenes]|uniref:Uncharacterized beta-barrel protein YwiB, DUF1934 family n=1 Tax=Eubacterium coprostanoligenes TaxID=290054 RepID=A0A1T4K145_9FIRM|nr:DUF1934 domain-containing protein [Eubacterium coprostanoligenes]MCI6254352.1 DUF1934 domain-containing protein [Eubacterium coprostanoligenes]MCI6354907.1 DUF1934 domain-containing protein [Eubacterium coprostanoligenes]MCI6361632.1 DUF1934 domain-containing protein [Eubacterium coprostanoligenes]MCI7265443.1 DUF1934 domain-containing protein [Eubacterium coprostanoligenes]MDD6666243.1 DUF1934 domain-containing protein [Eubacterium coprostanoligenes]
MAKALITIIGHQKFDDDKDQVEMKTVGTFEHDDDNYIIRYNEELENSTAPLRAKLNIAKDESKVEMIKSGAYSSCLIIEKSKRHLCNYGTEYGDMLMGIFGREIKTEFNETEGTFKFSYDIDINGAISSQNDVIIKFRLCE